MCVIAPVMRRAMIAAMNVEPIATQKMQPPQDDLLAVMQGAAFSLQEGDCLAVSSKVVSIWEGRCVSANPRTSGQRDMLAKQEASAWIEREEVSGRHALWTLTQGNLIGSAGIDASNADGHFILWPQDSHASAARIRAWCCKRYSIRQLAVIITDSHSKPLRRGVVGLALGWAGFDPLVDHRNAQDLFGRTFASEHTNLADALAASAVLVMGETNESTPLAVLRDVPYLAAQLGKQGEHEPSYTLTPEEDIFAPFWRNAPWKQEAGDRGRGAGDGE